MHPVEELPSRGIEHSEARFVPSIAFWGLLLVAAVLRVWLATKGHGIRHPDEVIQTIEQSHRIVFGYGIVPWEYREGIRWIGTPLMLAFPMWVAALFGLGADFYTALTRGLLALLSLAPFPLFFLVVQRRSGDLVAFLSCLLPLFWVEHLDFAGSTLSESIAAPVFACAVLATLLLERDGRAWHTVILAMLLTVTFCLRFHLAPALALIGVVALFRMKRTGRIAFVASLAGAFICLGALDLALGQMPFQHVYLNVYRNIVEGVAKDYGTEDTFYYFRSIWEHWGPGLIFPLAAVALRVRRTWLLWTSAIVVVLAFSAIDHKEYRFYYPATLLFTLAAGWALADLGASIAAAAARGARGVSALLTGVLLVLTMSPEGDRYASLAAEEEDPRIAAQVFAGQRGDVCGLGVDIGLVITGTAGLVHFHRDVAFDTVDVTPARDDTISRFNYVLVSDQSGAAERPYHVVQCWRDLCLYRREGGCTPSPAPPDGPN